ncbi:MAG: type II toxin-antitoxin system ParD family antitoxin [Tepidisphaeraceae bacterium]|jgi:putative addiction module CopG family antidote
MNVKLKPEVQKFVEEQVKAGRFASPSEVLDEAINRMKTEGELELDDETVAAILRAEQQLDRGEGIEFDQFKAEMHKRIVTQ